LSFYTLITKALHYLLKIYLNLRVKDNKEDSQRYQEKLCIYNQTFASEVLNAKTGKEVIHIHAASAGEFNAIKPLLKILNHPNRYLLVTTVTVSGALAFKQYKHTSPNIQHVYMPLDTPQAIQGFVDFWAPSALILVESEIWPNLLRIASKKQKICIINARLSEKSFRRWSKISFLLKELLTTCSFISTGTKTDCNHYKKFCSNVYYTGNLKYDSEQLTANNFEFEVMHESVNNRVVIACISTHPGEEEMLLKVYKELKVTIPMLLMIIAPRHIDRGLEISNLCFDNQVTSILRSEDNQKTNHIPNYTEVYIFNTIGELGLVFKIAKIVFIGGSLVNIGGHNVCEPIQSGCTVIIGKYHQNFLDIIEDMKGHNGIITVNNISEMAHTILELIAKPTKAQEIADNGKKCIESNKGAIQNTIGLLHRYGFIVDD
jgi:3-deoxy-D-manno-octulosonic-acid transferase